MKKMVQTDDLIFEYAKRDEEGNVFSGAEICFPSIVRFTIMSLCLL